MSYTIEKATGVTVVEHPTEITSDPKGQSSTVSRWTGLRSDIDAKVSSLGVEGLYPFNISRVGDSPLADLTVTYAGGSDDIGDTPIKVDYKFHCGVSQLPLAALQRFKVAINSLDVASKGYLKKIVEGQATADELEDFDIWLTNNVDGQYQGQIQDYVDLRLEGTDTYYQPDPIFVYQASYQASSGFRPNFANVAVVYSTGTLVSALNVPSDMAAGLAAGEWLAEEVDYETASDGSRVASQSFRYATEWDNRIYTHA